MSVVLVAGQSQQVCFMANFCSRASRGGILVHMHTYMHTYTHVHIYTHTHWWFMILTQLGQLIFLVLKIRVFPCMWLLHTITWPNVCAVTGEKLSSLWVDYYKIIFDFAKTHISICVLAVILWMEIFREKIWREDTFPLLYHRLQCL